jgi:hypothetical protein
MTAAFNLSQLANNLNSAGQLDATDGLVGTVPVTNGGTGLSSLVANNVILGNGTNSVQAVAPSTNENVLRSNGSTWVSSALSSLSSFDRSLSSSGYQRLPGGLIIQWGAANIPGNTKQAIALPIAFPNVCVSVACGGDWVNENGWTPYGGYPNNTTSIFLFSVDDPPSVDTVWYIAIGY